MSDQTDGDAARAEERWFRGIDDEEPRESLVMCDGCGVGPTPHITAGLLHHCGGTWRDAVTVMATFIPATPAVSSYRAPNDDDLPF